MTAQLFSTPSLRADGHTIWSIPLNRVHVTRSRANGARRSRYVHMRGATLKPGEVVTVDGVLVTSPARTVVDLARTVPFEQAVVVADAALAIGLVDAEAVGEVLQGLVRRRASTPQTLHPLWCGRRLCGVGCRATTRGSRWVAGGAQLFSHLVFAGSPSRRHASGSSRSARSALTTSSP